MLPAGSVRLTTHVDGIQAAKEEVECCRRDRTLVWDVRLQQLDSDRRLIARERGQRP